MGTIAGVILFFIATFSLVFALLAWTQKIEAEWDEDDNKNWDWHR